MYQENKGNAVGPFGASNANPLRYATRASLLPPPSNRVASVVTAAPRGEDGIAASYSGGLLEEPRRAPHTGTPRSARQVHARGKAPLSWPRLRGCRAW